MFILVYFLGTDFFVPHPVVVVIVIKHIVSIVSGLDNVILPYVNSFLNNEVKGHQLLCLRSDDLEHLGVYTLGHQELILEAVEQLRNFVSILVFIY